MFGRAERTFVGAKRSREAERERLIIEAFLAPMPSLPFGDAAAEKYAELRDALESVGARIGAYDMQIAAIAISAGLTLVTHDTREFARVTGLAWEDWQAEP